MAYVTNFPSAYTKVGDIVKNSSAFEGKEVKIQGKVTNVTKLPLVEKKLRNTATFRIPKL